MSGNLFDAYREHKSLEQIRVDQETKCREAEKRLQAAYRKEERKWTLVVGAIGLACFFGVGLIIYYIVTNGSP